MKGKISANCKHFTGKKNPFTSVKKHVIREPQEPHRLSPSGKARDFDSRIRWFESD